MMKIAKDVTELIGNTPLLEIGNIEKELELKAKVLVKLEYLNPAGSVTGLRNILSATRRKRGF